MVVTNMKWFGKCFSWMLICSLSMGLVGCQSNEIVEKKPEKKVSKVEKRPVDKKDPVVKEEPELSDLLISHLNEDEFKFSLFMLANSMHWNHVDFSSKEDFLNTGLFEYYRQDVYEAIDYPALIAVMVLDENEKYRVMNEDGTFSIDEMNRYLSLFTDKYIDEYTAGLYNLRECDDEKGIFTYPLYDLYSMDRIEIQNLEYDDSTMRVEFDLIAPEWYEYLNGKYPGRNYSLMAELQKDTDGLFEVVYVREVVDENYTGVYEQKDNSYILPYSNYEYLTWKDLNVLSLQEVNYARNEIYARHGRQFMSNELNEYFMSKAWYKGNVRPQDFDTSIFNEYEWANIQLLLEEEFSRNPNGYVLDQGW